MPRQANYTYKNDEHSTMRPRGVVQLVVLFIVFAAVLMYFGITAADISHSNIFINYIAPAGSWVWHTVIVGFIWHGFLGFFGVGSHTDMMVASSTAATTATSTAGLGL